MRSVLVGFRRLIAVAALYVFGAVFAGPAFAQALANGLYEINGDIDDPVTRAPFAGTFTVAGGTIDALTVKFADNIIATAPGATYSGTSIAIASATSLSGTLTETTSGFLTLNGDGTFDCGGSISDYCKFNDSVYGNLADEKTGNYTISLVTPINAVPTADAGGAATVASAETVTLDGSASDANDVGQSLTYVWTQTGGTAVTLSDASAAQPTFTAPVVAIGAADVVLTFSLVVNDGYADSLADTVTITVTATANTTPTADAGSDATVASAGSVMLDAGGSTANDVGQSLTYVWTQTGGTAVTLSDASAAQPTFTAPVVAIGAADAVLTFNLVVNDGYDDSLADTVTVTVTAQQDTIAPQAPTAANTTITTNTDGSITITGTAEPGATVKVTFPDGTVRTVLVLADGSYGITSGPSQPSGTVDIVVIDAAGNASAVLSLSYVAAAGQPTIEQIQTEIAGFMQSRASHVISSQPDLIGFLSGNAAGAFNADVTKGQGTFDFATSGTRPVWAQIQGNWSESGDSQNSYFFGAAGGHYAISPDAIAGVMLQFDRLIQENGDAETKGDGYLVGPYVVAKLPDQPLFVEGRYLVGKTENAVSIDGAAAQTFNTNRTLASIKVAGQMIYGDLTLTPNLAATRLKDTQTAFTDNLGRAIAEQQITVTDMVAGIDFAKPVPVDYGSLILTGGIAGIWSATEGEGFASTIPSNYEGGRGRVHLGASYQMKNGGTLTAGANYDGIGVDDYNSWGLALGLGINF